MYNYFIIEPSNTNGMSVTLYENPDKVGEAAIYATDWGDGVVDNNTSHTYVTPGTYTIKTKLQSAEADINNNITKCLNIRNDITDMSYFLACLASLVECCEIPNGVTNMEGTFGMCTSFNQPIVIPNGVTNILTIFYGCEMFNQEVVIPNSVLNASGAFFSCSSLNKQIILSNNLNDMSNMFNGCTVFNQPINIPNTVQDFSYAFTDCESYTHPIYVPSSITSLWLSFDGCKLLTEVHFDSLNIEDRDLIFAPFDTGMRHIYLENATTVEIINNIIHETFPAKENDWGYIYLDNVIGNFEDVEIDIANSRYWNILYAWNEFKIEPSSDNGMSVTLYENPDKVGEAAIYATDWGDGVVDNNTSHTYSAEGTYIIKTKLQSAETSNINNNITKCLNIRNDITDMSYFFKNFKSLVYCSSNIHDNIINMNCTFAECTLFNSPINIGKNVKTLGGTFSKCSNFNQSITIPNGVTDISELFDYCSNFNQPITIPDGVKDMSYTFRNCSNFNQSVNIPDGVEFIENIFYGCTAFNQEVIIPDSVTSVYAAFQNCTSFNSNVAMGSSITNANRVFQGCTNFNKPVVFGPNVTSLANAFLNCKSLNSLVTINSPVANMSLAFFGCALFNQPINIPNTTTNLTGVFQGCTNFNQPINIPKNAYNVNGILNGCISFNSIVTFDVSNETNLVLTDAFANSSVNSIKFTGTLQNELMTNILGILVNPTTIDIRELSETDTKNIRNNTNIMNIINTGKNGTPHILLYNVDTTLLFNYFEITTNNTNGYSITLYENPEYAGDVSAYETDWGDGTVNNSTSHTYSTNGTYTIKTKLQPSSEANKNSTNTNIVKCAGIREDITNLDYFFNNCTKLSTIENSVLLNVTTMKWCFNNCSSLVSINMSNWDLTNVVNMSYMFKDCVNLTNATFSNTTTLDSLENGENVFYNCTSLTDTNLLDQI